MNNEEIKKECEQIYVQIKSLEERLKDLRTKCNHEKTLEANYSFRVGDIQLADICQYCGELIKYK